MPNTIAQIQRTIQSNEVKMVEARKQADLARTTARQQADAGNGMRADVYWQQAQTQEQKEMQLQEENQKLTSELDELQRQVNALEQEKLSESTRHDTEMKRIEDQLSRLRGSGLVL